MGRGTQPNGYRFFTWDCHLFFHRIVVSAPFRHTTNWREGNTALGDGSQCGMGIRASFRLGSGRGPRPPREQYACLVARHSRGLRPFRVALLILDSRLAPTTSTVRGGPGQHMEKRINPEHVRAGVGPRTLRTAPVHVMWDAREKNYFST